ncbi:hypothetical protein F443_10975, partial [Phytophthora nicotianae P1569]
FQKAFVYQFCTIPDDTSTSCWSSCPNKTTTRSSDHHPAHVSTPTISRYPTAFGAANAFEKCPSRLPRVSRSVAAHYIRLKKPP